MWDSAVLTNSGLNLMAQWVDGAVLTIDKATAGEGTVNEAYLMGQTQLVAEKKQLSIVRQDRVANGVRIQMQCTNEGVTEEFTINQIGVWAHLNDGASVLLSIYQDDTGVLVPTNAEMPEYVFTFYAVLQVSNTGTLEVTIDASAVVTKAQLDEATAEIDDKIEKIVDGTTPVEKAINADTATKATQDASGNNITETYATKADLQGAGMIAITTALNENIPSGMLAGIVVNPQNYVVVSSSASNTPGFYVGRSGNTLIYRNNNLAFSNGQTIGVEFNIDTTTGRLTNTMFTLVSKAGNGYGTVNPTSKTEEMTEPVGVDSDGTLWAKSSGESFNPSGSYPDLTAGEATHAQSADTATSAASATDAVNAQLAVKATQDAAGNNIQSTYATKTGLNTKANQTALDGVINGTTPVAKATAADSATNATNDAQGRNIASTYALKSEVGTKKYNHFITIKIEDDNTAHVFMLLYKTTQSSKFQTVDQLYDEFNSKGFTSENAIYPASGQYQGQMIIGCYVSTSTIGTGTTYKMITFLRQAGTFISVNGSAVNFDNGVVTDIVMED